VRTREKNNLELLPGKSKPKSEVYALGMEQRSKIDRFAHRKDVPIKPKKEVYALGMEQRSKIDRFAHRKDVPIKPKKEVYALGMEQRSSVAHRKDVPIKPKKEVYALDMEQTVAHLKVVMKLRRGKRTRGRQSFLVPKHECHMDTNVIRIYCNSRFATEDILIAASNNSWESFLSLRLVAARCASCHISRSLALPLLASSLDGVHLFRIGRKKQFEAENKYLVDC